MIPPLTSTNFMVYPTGFLVFHDDHSADQIYSKRYWASCDTNSELRHPSGTSRTHIYRSTIQAVHNRSFAPQAKAAGILDFCVDTF